MFLLVLLDFKEYNCLFGTENIVVCSNIKNVTPFPVETPPVQNHATSLQNYARRSSKSTKLSSPEYYSRNAALSMPVSITTPPL
jgi:hypothetical protein